MNGTSIQLVYLQAHILALETPRQRWKSKTSRTTQDPKVQERDKGKYQHGGALKPQAETHGDLGVVSTTKLVYPD